MAIDIETLRQRVLAAGGEYGSAATRAQRQGPRSIESVRSDMAALWGGGKVVPGIAIEGHGTLTPPTIQFEDACVTSFMMSVRMVHKALWDEAQASLKWLLAHAPVASATPETKAAWIDTVFSWIDIQVLASNLHPLFWNIPDAGLTPQCRNPSACDPDLLRRNPGACCPPWAPYYAALEGSTLNEPLPFATANSSKPHPFTRIREFSEANGFAFAEGGAAAVRHGGVKRCLTGLLTCRGAWQALGVAGGGSELWLNYRLGAQLPRNWSIPIPALQRIRADAGTSSDRADDAEEIFTSLSVQEQLASIFLAMPNDTAAVSQVRGRLDASRYGGCNEMWTMATPAGLIQQTRWWAEYYAYADLEAILGRAMLFYTGNHLPYFIERGILNISAVDMKDAYEAMAAKGAQEVGAAMSTLGSVMVAIVAAAAGANVILGLLVAIAVGLYQLWMAATGSTGLFDIVLVTKGFANDVPQPLFIRTMPACEARARALAETNSLPLGTVEDDLPAAPKLSPGIAILLGGLAGGLIAWAFS